MDRKHMPRLYFLLTVALCFVGVVLRAACMLTQFDPAVGYFERGLLPMASTTLYFVVVVAALIGACALPKDVLPTTLRTPYRAPLAYTVGLALVAFAVLSFALSYEALLSAGAVADWALILSALLAAAYFLVTARLHGVYQDAVVFLGFFPILWSISAVAVTYSDPFMTMNSPIKVSLLAGLLGFMLIMLAELNCRLGKPVSRKTILLTSVGTYIALVASLPLLVSVSDSAAPIYFLCPIVLLAVALYGGYVLFCYTHSPAPDNQENSNEPCASGTPLDSND